MNISLLYNNFLGETSPLIAARIDSPAYEMGARRMENFIPMLSGGIRKRPGTWFDKYTHLNKKARLIEWLLSDGNCLLLEITEQLIKAWKVEYDNDDKQIKLLFINSIEIDYTGINLRQLQYAASANSMWIVHAEKPVLKLDWNGSIVEESDIEFLKYVDQNEQSGFQTCKTCKGTGFIYKDSPCSQCNETGKLKCAECGGRIISMQGDLLSGYFIFATEEDNQFPGIMAGEYIINGNSIRFNVAHPSSFTINGEISSTVTTLTLKNLSSSYTLDKHMISRWNGTYKFINGVFPSDVIDIIGAGIERCVLCQGTGKISSSNCYQCQGLGYYLCLTCRGSGEIKCLTCNGSGKTDEICSICNGAGHIYIEPDMKPEYIFNSKDNYPGAIAFNAGRLFFAGLISQPNRIFASMAPDSQAGTDRYRDFSVGDTPAHAIVIEENDMHGSRIQWLAANRYFLAATERATWSDTGDIPTPQTFDMNIIEYAGASEIQARGTREIMIYAGRDGKTLRALVWNDNASGSGFIGMDISEQAAHLFGSGIVDFAVSDFPSMLWIVTEAGELISCTINIRGGILAYARHITDGIVEEVSVVPQKTGDVIFIVVKRGEERNIEHIVLEDLVNEDFNDSHYVDAGIKIIPPEPTKIIEGLDRFEGKKINVFSTVKWTNENGDEIIDSAIEPSIVVENGKIELQNEAIKVHIGLPYESTFAPNDRQIPANGTSLGKKRRLEKITLKLHRSLGGKAGVSENKATALSNLRYGNYKLGSAPEPFTGEIDVTVSGNIDTEGKLVISHDEPVPFTLLALVERVAILEV